MGKIKQNQIYGKLLFVVMFALYIASCIFLFANKSIACSDNPIFLNSKPSILATDKKQVRHYYTLLLCNDMCDVIEKELVYITDLMEPIMNSQKINK